MSAPARQLVPLGVGTRTTSLQVRRRKAAVGVSLPGSSPWSLSADDPEETFTVPEFQRRVFEFSSRATRGANLHCSAISAI